jgi:hypothetical protein
MKIRSLLLTLFCAICFSASAQIDSFQQHIIDYLENNGTEAQYSEAYDGMFEVLKKQFVNPEVPESVWTELKQGKEESIREVIEFLTFAYRKHFTEAEIIEMAAFYKSEAAQKMVTQAPDTTQEDSDEVAAFFNSALGKKIESKREVLSVDIAEISQHWSRDLFASKMSILVKKGYSAN